MMRLITRLVLFAALLAGAPLATPAVQAQPVIPSPSVPPVARDTSRANRSCVALPSWDLGVVCGAQSRREEYIGGLLVGGTMGALVGVPSGLLFRGECNHGVRSAVGRGALAGMAVSTIALTVLPRASRAVLEDRQAAEREQARRSRGRRVWMAVRPVLTMVGTAAVGGAMIGAFDGARATTNCGDAPGAGALRGAAVYSAGAATIAAFGAAVLVTR